jgi:hypothetical protein
MKSQPNWANLEETSNTTISGAWRGCEKSFLVADKPSLAFAAVLSTEHRQAAKMALLGAEYIARAGKFPPELSALVTQTLLDLQATPGQVALPLSVKNASG